MLHTVYLTIFEMIPGIVKRFRIGLSAMRAFYAVGYADRHFLIMMLLFRLARKIVLKSLPPIMI